MQKSGGSAVARIQGLDRRGLIRVWKQIEDGKTTSADWPPGIAFEQLVLRSFELEGAMIRWPFKITMSDEVIEQIDGVVHIDWLSCLCECKDQDQPVNIEPIAKLRNQLMRRPAPAIGMIFSRSGFTDPALILARFLAPQTILLWHGKELQLGVKRGRLLQMLHLKYRFAIEEGVPDFNTSVLAEE